MNVTSDRMTDQEARALTFLAAGIRRRLYRAPTWDEAGIYENVIRCRDTGLSTAEVVLRTIRAAADRDAITPGVIPKNGPHANEQLKPEPWTPNVVPPERLCSVCGKDRQVCESAPRYGKSDNRDDHEFEPDFREKRSPQVAADIKEALRAEIAVAREVANESESA